MGRVGRVGRVPGMIASDDGGDDGGEERSREGWGGGEDCS